jgi:hypothetical protein
MANFLKEIGQFLITNEVAKGLGTDLFLEQRPDNPDKVVTLFEYAGDPSSAGIDAVVRKVQVMVRDTNAQAAKEKSWNIYNLLDRPLDRVIKLPERWIIPQAIQTPYRLNIDERNRPVYVFNLSIATQRY